MELKNPDLADPAQQGALMSNWFSLQVCVCVWGVQGDCVSVVGGEWEVLSLSVGEWLRRSDGGKLCVCLYVCCGENMAGVC